MQPFQPSSRAWLYTFMLRRAVMAVTLVTVTSWPVLLGIALGVELLWTVLRELRRPFARDFFRNVDRVLTLLSLGTIACVGALPALAPNGTTTATTATAIVAIGAWSAAVLITWTCA